MRGNFSDANVFSSTFDNYTEALMGRIGDLNLPVFTEEIGDTWIYGVGSDVDKVAEYRAFPQSYTSYEMRNFSRFLIKVPEHTWGVDTKIYLDDYSSRMRSCRRRLQRTSQTTHTLLMPGSASAPTRAGRWKRLTQAWQRALGKC